MCKGCAALSSVCCSVASLVVGRLTFDEDDGPEFYDGAIKDDEFNGRTQVAGASEADCNAPLISLSLLFLSSGLGCYAWPDNSFYFGSFRHHERNGLGIFFLPRGDDDLVSSDWLTADREPFTLHPAISKQNGVHAMWRRKDDDAEERINGSSHAAGSSSSSSASPSPPAAAAAAAAPAASAAASSSSDGGDAQLVWQALHRLIKQAVPAVIRLQHERKQLTNHSSLPPPPDYHVSECVRAALDRFSSASLFHLISVPNAVHDLRRKGVCSYLITGELGCAEQPYLCLTCAEDPSMQDDSAASKGSSFEMCQACAERSSCHAGHSLRALVSTRHPSLWPLVLPSLFDSHSSPARLLGACLQPPRRRFVCDCGRRHALLATTSSSQPQQHAPSLNVQAAASQSGGASKAAAAPCASAMMDDAPEDDSASPAPVCSGMQVKTNPSEWAKAVWPATVAQAERAMQAEEEKAQMEAMQ